MFRILDVSDGGKNLSYKLITDILNQEIEIIRINEPDRAFIVNDMGGSKITDRYMRIFAKRNGLDKYVNRDREKMRQSGSECDICYKKFTTDKNMRDHRKRIHFSFLIWLWFQIGSIGKLPKWF